MLWNIILRSQLWIKWNVSNQLLMANLSSGKHIVLQSWRKVGEDGLMLRRNKTSEIHFIRCSLNRLLLLFVKCEPKTIHGTEGRLRRISTFHWRLAFLCKKTCYLTKQLINKKNVYSQLSHNLSFLMQGSKGLCY